MRKPRWTIASKTQDGRTVSASFHSRHAAATAIQILRVFGIRAKLVNKYDSASKRTRTARARTSE